MAYILGQRVGPNPFYSYEISRFYGNVSIDIYCIERIIAYEKASYNGVECVWIRETCKSRS